MIFEKSFISFVIFAALFNFTFAEERELIQKRLEEVARATVQISSQDTGENIGSGFIVDYKLLPSGDLQMTVLTAGHVAEHFIINKEKPMVFVMRKDGATDFGVGVDSVKLRSGYKTGYMTHPNDIPIKDIAMLRSVMPKKFFQQIIARLPRPVPIRLTPLKMGERVSFFGYPATSDVLVRKTADVLSKLGSSVYVDCAVEVGFSGGPIVDEAGRAVGVCKGYSSVASQFEPVLRSSEFFNPLTSISQERREKLYKDKGVTDAVSYWEKVLRELTDVKQEKIGKPPFKK